MKNSHIYSLILVSTFAFSAPSFADISSSFKKAKTNLYKKVYPNEGLTFYTNCEWAKKKVDLASCGFENSFSKKLMKRAIRTEAEHIIPSSWMYRKNKVKRACYIESKAQNKNARAYCQKHDKDYRNAHNDLVNLRPAVGAINLIRSNKPFSDVLSGSKPSTYRGNGKQFKASSRVAVPDVSIRGDIARVAFYMRDTYGVIYSKRQTSIFNKWDKQDAVSEEEILLNKQIKNVQGVGNHYVLKN